MSSEQFMIEVKTVMISYKTESRVKEVASILIANDPIPPSPPPPQQSKATSPNRPRFSIDTILALTGFSNDVCIQLPNSICVHVWLSSSFGLNDTIRLTRTCVALMDSLEMALEFVFAGETFAFAVVLAVE